MTMNRKIQDVCAERGLELIGVKIDGDLVELVASDLRAAAVLDVKRLRELAIDIKATWGVRYVTLSLDAALEHDEGSS